MDEESSYGAGDSTTCEPTSAGCAKCDTREDQVLRMPATSRTRSIAPKAQLTHADLGSGTCAQDQTYCSTNGFKQEVECSIGRLSNQGLPLVIEKVSVRMWSATTR